MKFSKHRCRAIHTAEWENSHFNPPWRGQTCLNTRPSFHIDQRLSIADSNVCEVCAGFRFIMCEDCNGSHKLFTEKSGFKSTMKTFKIDFFFNVTWLLSDLQSNCYIGKIYWVTIKWYIKYFFSKIDVCWKACINFLHCKEISQASTNYILVKLLLCDTIAPI